ncbi:hypothetical protein BGW36DRAFT_425406 [Talaromyces proteolyticus]|uniref:ER membrane protein complex subunit 6 n=1 Tax=Talaromyces proteolyticus TaxID=1131652 RepID=A0AAD4KZB5_9EURO|nr:uncharacterized protein BGW36DRAFT_425406 [Talaromyces proteolyticus]KAH8700590.1 hypothetical protein BGW36DRAFT_425406 [Talaromyces proteolyticus]
MPPTQQELSLLIHPLVPESVQHNNRVLSQLRSLTAFLLGITAGILGLQSASGFTFYFVGTIFVSGLVQILLIGTNSPSGGAEDNIGAYFPGASGGEVEGIDGTGKIHAGSSGGKRAINRKGAWRDIWLGGGVMGEALSGFILGWAGVGGVLR